MSQEFVWVKDGQEQRTEISHHLSTAPLPPEIVSAAIDTLSQAIIGLAGAVGALATGDLEESSRRLRAVAGMTEGMRRDLGMQPMLILDDEETA